MNNNLRSNDQNKSNNLSIQIYTTLKSLFDRSVSEYFKKTKFYTTFDL